MVKIIISSPYALQILARPKSASPTLPTTAAPPPLLFACEDQIRRGHQLRGVVCDGGAAVALGAIDFAKNNRECYGGKHRKRLLEEVEEW